MSLSNAHYTRDEQLAELRKTIRQIEEGRRIQTAAALRREAEQHRCPTAIDSNGREYEAHCEPCWSAFLADKREAEAREAGPCLCGAYDHPNGECFEDASAEEPARCAECNAPDDDHLDDCPLFGGAL